VLLLAGRINERAGGGDPAGADHVDRHARAHELDDVVDGVAGLHMAAGRIDVDLDRLGGFVDQRQDPRHHAARHLVVDLAEHHDLAPFEEARFQLVDESVGGLLLLLLRHLRLL
jgi:hypothetical protein